MSRAVLRVGVAIACCLPVLAAAQASPVAPTVAASAADATPGEKFPIWEFRVLGNSLLANEEIEAAIYPYLGTDKSLKDVEAAQGALAELYKQRGFGTVFIDIPEQSVDGGVVRLKVTEGRLDRVRITGGRYFANNQIREQLPALRSGTTPNLPELQTRLTTINRQSPDRTVVPVLKAGRTPGTVDLELKVKDELPVHASAEVNDKHTADTTDTRLGLNLSYGNLFQQMHSLSFQYQTAPQKRDETQVIAATYVAPLGSGRNLVAAYAVDTDSDVATVGTLSVLGKGRIYGARFIHMLPDSPTYTGSVTFGADYKDFIENIRLVDSPAQRTPISYLNWSVSYTGNHRSTSARTMFDIGANFGIRGLANSSDEFWFKRYSGTPNKGDPGYFYLRANAERDQAIFGGMHLVGRAAAQFTPHALISNEQFSIGGADSVRGYLEAEELGDYGASATLELQSPSILTSLMDAPANLVFLAFADAGVVRIQAPLPDQESGTDLSSVGLGLRFDAFGGMQGALDWAYPLTTSEHVEKGDTRLHFQMRYGF